MPDELTDVEVLNEEVEEVEKPLIEEDIDAIASEDEDEDKETEEDEEDEEVKDKNFPFEVPSFSEIKAEFPEFFKKFPQFRDLVFQQAEYRKIFSTVEDAKEANDDIVAFNGLRDGVLAGKADVLIDAIEETDKAASERFALSFLPALHKKNSELCILYKRPKI